MKCSHCGAENNDGANFCSNCGKPIQLENETDTPATVSDESANVQEQPVSASPIIEIFKNLSATTLIGLIFSSIAFFTGLVLYSLILAKKWLIFGPDTLVFIPAFAGLALSLKALRHDKDVKGKLVNIISVSLPGFAIFYGFLTYCICLG